MFRFLKNNFPQEPRAVDRLIVSLFIKKNKLEVRNNIFLKEYIINEKADEEYKNLTLFLSYFCKHKSKFNFETLIELFEFVISPSDRIINGAVYTPKSIREFIIAESFALHGRIDPLAKVADPACGCGGFLYNAAIRIKKLTRKTYADIFKENVYGLDIKDYSITRSKLLLSLLALSAGEDCKQFQFNLFEGNALNFDWNKRVNDFSGFDLIVGNPPYVCSRNIEEETKTYLARWNVCSSGHPDLYIPFFQLGLESLKESGVLGYITMNTFFKSVNGRALREYFKKFPFDFKIFDFGGEQVFKTKSTYTCICLIHKIESDSLRYIKLFSDEVQNAKTYSFNIIKYSSLNSYHGWNLQEVELLKRIEGTGTPLGHLYKTRSGIATLKNGVYIFDPIREDKEHYYLQNGSVYPIEKLVCKDIVNPNKLTQKDSIEYLKKKTIFPYFFEGKIAKLLPEKEFRKEFPLAYKYLHEKKHLLAERDKGRGNYDNWYAYGRSQSLEKLKNKLFFPHITQSIPNYVINADENLLFYNGLAVISDSEEELQILKKLMSSRIFWFYIVNSSKPYGSGFFSLSRNYIKNFGIYSFSSNDKEYILSEKSDSKLNSFFEIKYAINLKV